MAIDQIFRVKVGQTKPASINCTPFLAGASMTGQTPTVSEPSGLTIGTPAVSLSTYVQRPELTGEETGPTIAAGQAIQFTITGVSLGRYELDFDCATDDASITVEESVIVICEP